MAETCDYMQTDTRKELERVRAERDALKAEVEQLREAALDLACEHMGMDSNEELLLWLETLPNTDPGHSTPWGRFFSVLAKLGETHG
jgi:hypothetical protein